MNVDAIKKSGYLPFYEGVATDHRAVYIDIDAKYLFSNAQPDTNKTIFRRFTSEQPKKADKYLKRLEEELEKARVFQKAKILKREMETFLEEGKGDIEEMKKRCKILAEKTYQLMIHSDKKVGRRHYKHGFPSSPKLKAAAYEVIELKKLIRVTSINEVNGKEKLKKLRIDLKEKYRELRNVSYFIQKKK